MNKGTCEKSPQVGPDCSAVGESHPASAGCPSYSGVGNKCLPSVSDKKDDHTRDTRTLILANDEARSDAGSESDAASGGPKGSQSSEREVVGAAAKNLRFFRKRPKSGDGMGSLSDDELASARKIPTSRRGGGRDRGVGRGLTTQEAAHRAERLTAEGRHPGSTSRRTVVSGSSGDELDDAGGSNSERAARFAEVVGAAIRDVALKRNKSSKDKAISAATASIMAAAEANHDGPLSDGMSEMRAEVARLKAGMELLQKENEKLRADLAGLRGASPPEMPQVEAQHVQGRPVPAEDRVLNLVRQELAAFQSRFSALEAIVLRPPLTARQAPLGQRKAASFAAAAGAAAKSGLLRQANHGAIQEPTSSASAGKSAPKKGGGVAQAVRAPAPVSSRSPQSLPPPESSAADAEWQVAGEKRKAGKAARAAKRKEKRKRQRKERSVAARLRAPKSAAVVISLQPEADKKGVSYREVLSQARAAVNLQELGVTEGIRVRVTATGARMLEVPGEASGPIADALAERLRASLNADEVRVSRPTKCADIRITGLDDSVVEREVVAAVVRTGGCTVEQVRAGSIRPDVTGMRAVTVSCPVSAAQKIAGEGRRLLVGWVSAQVKLLEPRPLRCFRCHIGNHVGAKCTSEVDRSDHCFRCGQPGHKASSCYATPHCVVCAAAGKPADHRAGSKTCAPPAKARGRGKPSTIAVTVAAAATAAATAAAAATPTAVVAAETNAVGPSQGAQEGAVMECQ